MSSVKRNNIRLIRFYKIKGSGFNSYHSATDGILNVVVAQEDIISAASLVNIDALKSCLELVSSNIQSSQCRVKFDD